MAELSPEARSVYDLVTGELDGFLDKKLDNLASVLTKSINAKVDAVTADFTSKLDDLRDELQFGPADTEKGAPAFESAPLASTATPTQRVPAAPPPAATASSAAPAAAAGVDTGPDGLGAERLHRGQGFNKYIPPPARGMRLDHNSGIPHQFGTNRPDPADVYGSGPRIELPRFDGSNPRLWQDRCEDYFALWGTPQPQWIQFASAQFEGAAARWLESARRRIPRATWSEFCQHLVQRFGRNQHRTLVRQLCHISQITYVAEYVERFSELYDQVTAYEICPEIVHYVTHFIDGLKPTIRMAVAIQQPVDLDAAVQLAMLYEELSDDPVTSSVTTTTPSTITRRTNPTHNFPVVPRAPVVRQQDDRRVLDSSKPATSADKWNQLRNFRKAKGLCFICGEKWTKEHQCSSSVQLHVVHEMMDYLQLSDNMDFENETEGGTSLQAMCISAAAMGTEEAEQTMQISVNFQGMQLSLLIDSGSTHSFLDSSFMDKMSGVSAMRPVPVKIANGALLHCTHQLKDTEWNSCGSTFSSTFRFITLGAFDGIIGLDWLTKHSPMTVDWAQQWMNVPNRGGRSLLIGIGMREFAYTMIEVSSITCQDPVPVHPMIQPILDDYADVFAAPEGLPPRRQYDHVIPLVPGARPVSLRPYRVVPALKTEIEKQVAELLKSGVIQHSNSPFSSPVILVKKKDSTWRMVVDYRHLNALTIKGKYPLPIIDELLDELAGACYFSKLDLRAGYHQIRLAPGEEFKTAFQTHNGHYEFKVMAFGLTGAPGTFQGAMNASLAPVSRECALVFFDDILVYSKTLEDHVTHLKLVLEILQRDNWKVKLSKCAFAQERISYLGHVISKEGVATDDSKTANIKDWPVPTNVKEIRQFLGLTGYYRKFVRHYGVISKPLTNLLRKGSIFVWTPVEEEAFQTLKLALISAPVLALPDFNKVFVLETDASDKGIGAVLMQDGHPLAYVSKALGPKTSTLSVYEKEYLAILLAVEHWRPYLQMKEFIIRTDHKSLTNLNEQRLHTNWQHKALTKLMGLQYQIVYNKGCDNGAADALSRRSHDHIHLFAISSVHPVWFQDIIASYSDDPKAQDILQQLAAAPDHASGPYKLCNGMIKVHGCIWIGHAPDLHSRIFLAFHASPIGGHSGFPVTYNRIRSLFRWVGMRQYIKTRVQTCLICQQAKSERVAYPGLLQPLPVPQGAWETVTMDFIEGLPSSGHYNSIIVFVDTFTKYAHFAPLHHLFNAHTIVDVFLDTVHKLHSMPRFVVSDRDKIFTSHFWQEILTRTGAELDMSTAYHPQSDGQTERVNQQIECYLRCFISAHPRKWSRWLPLCEFWYNTNWHSSLNKSPFEVLYGYSPRYFGLSASDTLAPSDVQQWLDNRAVVTESVRQHLLRVKQRMKHHADKKRTERHFSVGDMVFLKLQPYVQSSVASRACHKLAFRFFGPYKVLQKIGTVAYRLELPASSRIHPVFHVSQLKQYLAPHTQVQSALPSDDANLHVPAKVLQNRVVRRGHDSVAQGLIQWSNSPSDLATWEDLDSLKQSFPRAPAWGQAEFKAAGIVSSTNASGKEEQY